MKLIRDAAAKVHLSKPSVDIVSIIYSFYKEDCTFTISLSLSLVCVGRKAVDGRESGART